MITHHKKKSFSIEVFKKLLKNEVIKGKDVGEKRGTLYKIVQANCDGMNGYPTHKVTSMHGTFYLFHDGKQIYQTSYLDSSVRPLVCDDFKPEANSDETTS